MVVHGKHYRLGNGNSSPVPYQVHHCALHGLICMPLEFLVSLRIGNEPQSGQLFLSGTLCSVWPLINPTPSVSSSCCSHLVPCTCTAVATPKANSDCTFYCSLACAFRPGFSFLLNLSKALESLFHYSVLYYSFVLFASYLM